MSDFVFTPEADWVANFIEEREFETEIFVSDGGYEQRSSARDIPHRRFSFDVSSFEARESGLLEVLLRHAQGEPCWIPYWVGARYLGADAAIGATVLAVNTVNAGFEIGQAALIIRDAHIYEKVNITSLSSSTVGVSPILKAWRGVTNRDRVVPLFQGHLAPSVDIEYVDKTVKTVSLIFDIISGVNTASPAPVTVPGPDFDFLDDFESYDSTDELMEIWGFEKLFKGINFSLDKTGGEGGGAALLLTAPPNSNFGASTPFPTAYATLRHLVEGVYTMTVRIKTSWNVTDPNGIAQFGGHPGITLTNARGPGNAFVPATAAAFGAWETLVANEFLDFLFGHDLYPSCAIEDGSGTGDTKKVWFDNIHVTGPGPSLLVEVPPIFAPLEAVHPAERDMHTSRRDIQQLENKAGIFGLFPYNDFPVGIHDIELDFDSAIAAQQFWAFHALVQGARRPWWIPSFHQDFDLTVPVGAADTTFTFKSINYSALMEQDPNRRQIAFIRPNNSFLKRTVLSCVDNGDGTETATLNEALGEIFDQEVNKGVCFMWFVRFDDDVAHIEWDGLDGAFASFKVVEVRDAPSGSGSDLGIPV
jgi:hypothetical protein